VAHKPCTAPVLNIKVDSILTASIACGTTSKRPMDYATSLHLEQGHRMQQTASSLGVECRTSVTSTKA
jgi:hypothetical protein